MTRSWSRDLTVLSVVVAGFLASVSNAHAVQVDFGSEQLVFGDAALARELLPGDLDGDGHVDLLLTQASGPSQPGGVVGWLRNVPGSGPRSPLRILAEGFDSAAVGDVDGDGDLDVVVAARATGRLQWLEHLDGQARYWSAHTLIDEPSLVPTAVATADLDGDGDADVLYTDDSTGSAWWLERFATSFSAPRLINDVLVGADEVLAADLDGDGDLDPITASQEVACGWQRNLNGQGALGVFQAIAPVGALQADVGDLDGDGDLDVVSTRIDRARWDENTNGQGAFVKAQDIDSFFAGFAIRPGDFDGDDDLDLLLVSSNADHVAWYENADGLGTYGAALAVDDSQGSVRDGVVFDLDGDGDDDVAVGAGPPGDWSVVSFENLDGQPGFAPGFAPGVVVAPALDSATSVLPVDVDGDGDLDLVSSGEGGFAVTGRIHWSENLDGAGAYSAPRLVHAGTGRGVTRVLARDLDGDGDVDLLAALGNDDHTIFPADPVTLSWFENLDGAGTFGGQQVFSFGVLAERVDIAAFDVDEDGDVDPFVLDGNGALAWFPNDGSGGLGAPQIPAFLSNPGDGVSPADIDGDGHLDLLIQRPITEPDPVALWFRGDGSGALAGPFAITSEPLSPSWVGTADLDGDGDLDAITGNGAGDHAVSWFANLDGLGSFGAAQGVWATELNFAGADTQVAAGDLDQDGDVDLLANARVGLITSSSTWVLVQLDNLDGLGGFGPGQPLDVTLSFGNDLQLADLDGDGDQDLAFAETYRVGWLENHGPWTDLGAALAGSWGEPRLSGDGSLLAGDDTAFQLTHAGPGSSAWLVMGISELSAPFKGGTLVPLPAFVVGGLPIAADGTLALSFVMPPAGSGMAIYTQLWVVDAVAPLGLSASNGLLGVVP